MTAMTRGSVEYLAFTLTDRDGADLSADTVTVALVARGSDPDAAAWLACTHDSGDRWRTASPVTWSTANYPDSSYLVFAKVADSPETPKAQLGTVFIH